MAARARAERTSLEAAGHRVRYELFERIVRDGKADCVATAHTRDDQAETVLLRLIRGAGPGGLGGIRPRIGTVVRPLLDVRRHELRDYLCRRGLSHREDASNRDERVVRNRVRHTLIPLLAEHFSPAITDVLARGAAIARADADWIDRAANAAAKEIVQCTEGGLDVDAARLAAAPVPVARRIVGRVLERVGGRRVGFDHVERFRRLAEAAGTAPDAADFPGCRVERCGALAASHAAARSPVVRRWSPHTSSTCSRCRASRGDRREAGLRITAECGERPARLVARGDAVALPAGRITLPLTVRNWRPGDVFRPLGLGGRKKKLQDFFVDRKIPRGRRGAIPLVVDAGLGIVWVAGHAVAEEARVIDSDEGVVILRIVEDGR